MAVHVYPSHISCLLFVSPVPEQPFPRTEDCTMVRYITELSHTSSFFNNSYLAQQSSLGSTILFLTYK